MLGHTATCAGISTQNIGAAEVMNSGNSNSTHSTIPRRVIYITTDTTSSYFGINFK